MEAPRAPDERASSPGEGPRSAPAMDARTEGLSRLVRSLGAAMSPKAVAELVLPEALALAGAYAGGIYVLTDDRQALELLHVRGYPETVSRRFERIPLDAPLPAADAVRRGERLFLSNRESCADEYPGLRQSHSASQAWLVLPLLIRDTCLGALALSFDAPAAPTEDEWRFLDLVARLCAQALERARLFETERHARAELERERRALHRLFHQTPAAVAMTRGPDHRYVLSNPANDAYLGRHPREGHRISEEVPELAGTFLPLLDRVYSTGEALGGREVPVRLTGPGGEEREVFIDFVYEPTRDHEGKVDGVATFAFDVTAGVQARQQLRLLMDAVPVLISYVDRGFVYRLSNRTYQRIFHLPEDEMVGRHLRDVLGEQGFEVVRPRLERAFRGESFSYETLLPLPDGTQRWLEVTYTPDLDTAGQVRGVVVLGQDIGERKASEVERLGLLESERRARREAELIADRTRGLHLLTGRFAGALAPRQVWAALLDAGTEALGATTAGVWLLDEPGQALELVDSRGFPEVSVRDFARLPLGGDTPLERVFQQGEPVWLRDWSEFAERFPPTEERARRARGEDDVSMALLPLQTDGRRVGAVLFTFAPHPDLRQELGRWSLQLLVAQAAQAYARARLFEEQSATRARLEALVSASPAAILLLDADGTVRLWNPAAERTYGWRREEVLGVAAPTLSPGEAEALHARLSAQGNPGSLIGLEAHRRTRTSGRIDVALHAALIHLQEGRTQLLLMETDISAHKRAERHTRLLAEAGELLSSSLDLERTLDTLSALVVPGMADGCAIHLVDEDGRARTVALTHPDPARTAAAQGFFDRFPLQLSTPGGPGHVLRTGEPELVPELTSAMLEAGARTPGHLVALRELGIRSYLCVPLRSRGRVIAALTLAYAETDRRYTPEDLALAGELARRAATSLDNALLYREAQQAVQVRDRFLSIASHELNTPLTSLKLNFQTLQRALQGPKPLGREAVDTKFETLQRQLGRLASLIRELLDLGRISSGRLRLEPEPMDLVDLTREVITRMADDAARVGCEVKLEAPGSLHGHWDRLRMDQVIQNLLSNALKYGQGAPVDVRLSERPGEATLAVRDRGIGISAEDQQRIFQRFSRVVSEKNYSGFGLGLWIVHQTVEAMGGRVHVESETGRGATFTVTVPLSTPPART